MSLLGRIGVIIFALIVSSIAVGMAIAVGLLGPGWHAFSGDVGERVTFWGVAFFGSVLTGAIGLLPLIIVIALAEAFRIRSLLINTAAGAALLVVGYTAGGLRGPDTGGRAAARRRQFRARWRSRPRPVLSAASSTGSSPAAMPAAGAIGWAPSASPNRARLRGGHCPRTVRHRR